MKRLLSAALALALLSGTAATAEPFGPPPPPRHHHDHHPGHHPGHGSWHHRHHHDDTGAAVAVGVGLLALTAIIAASERERAAQDYAPPPGDQNYGPGYEQDYGPDQGPDADQPAGDDGNQDYPGNPQ